MFNENDKKPEMDTEKILPRLGRQILKTAVRFFKTKLKFQSGFCSLLKTGVRNNKKKLKTQSGF